MPDKEMENMFGKGARVDSVLLATPFFMADECDYLGRSIEGQPSLFERTCFDGPNLHDVGIQVG